MVDNVELDYDTLAAILYICNSKLEKVFSVSVSDNVEQLLDYISRMLSKSCLENKGKSIFMRYYLVVIDSFGIGPTVFAGRAW